MHLKIDLNIDGMLAASLSPLPPPYQYIGLGDQSTFLASKYRFMGLIETLITTEVSGYLQQIEEDMHMQMPRKCSFFQFCNSWHYGIHERSI